MAIVAELKAEKRDPWDILGPTTRWIYSRFIVDLPIENDDFMGFWYGIYWVTLWL
jgi:hypothetical protein